MLRELCLIATTGLMAASCLALSYVDRRIGRFLAETAILRDEADLDRFKAAAAACMYAVLISIAAGLGSVAVWLTALVMKIAGEFDLVPGLLIWFGRFMFLGFKGMSQEHRIKTIPAATPKLIRERDEVVRIWNVSPIPPWPLRPANNRDF
jgi:hypothetical protein